MGVHLSYERVHFGFLFLCTCLFDMFVFFTPTHPHTYNDVIFELVQGRGLHILSEQLNALVLKLLQLSHGAFEDLDHLLAFVFVQDA